MCSIDWEKHSIKTISNKIEKIIGHKPFHVSGIYDFLCKFEPETQDIANQKLDELRKLAEIRHTMTLIEAEKQ